MAKSKWQEHDWEVVLAAQTFVAVLAAPAGEEEPAPAAAKAKSKGRAKAKGKRTAAKAPTRRSTRSKAAPAADVNDSMDGERGGSKTGEASTPPEEEKEEFWLAELQDDVTEDMLGQEDVSVHVTWLNKTSGNRYEMAYDDHVDVSCILCHVFLRELNETMLELTPKSLARVQRSLANSKARLASGEEGDATLDEEEEEDNERPPAPRTGSSRGRKRHAESVDGGSGRNGAAKSKKLSKREAVMHIPPKRVMVDASKYQDSEMFGSQPFRSFNGDVASANREVVRAVLTENVALLKALTTKRKDYAELSSFNDLRSTDVTHSALRYAIDNDDLVSAALLQTAEEKIDKQELAAMPDVALPGHSTGKHMSRFSDYNRRAINASRGGKEGNNALLEDMLEDAMNTTFQDLGYFWRSPGATIEMLTLLYPMGQWTTGFDVENKVCLAARCGNFRLVRKVVETLEKDGGWGFNELHHKVLADGLEVSSDDEGAPLLPPFRAVSAIKQADRSRIRPLHLAAINPNTKYLEALWAVVGDEFGAVKDSQGYEAVHYAAGCEAPAPMIFLMERRCNQFSRTTTRLTPLMCALEAGRETTALALLKFVTMPGENGGGGQEVIDKLVRERGPGGKQAVHFAASHGCAQVLEYLLAECSDAADVNASSGGTTKATPLVLAAQQGHLECVRVLLAHGARVDLGDKLKKTPLILAVKNGHTRVAAMLINAGANLNAYDSSENSVAHYAASYGWTSSLQLLCDAGAELWSQNSWGFVPLACALLKQRRACAELILAQVSGDAQRKFLDFRDRQGRTMLFLQCQQSHSLEQLSYLLKKGLNPNVSDSYGEFPLQRLIKRASDETRKNGNSGDGEHAAFYLKAVRLLLQHGAYSHYDLPPEEPKDGKDDLQPLMLQPLQQAMVGNQMEIFELLLDQQGVRSDAPSSDGIDAWMTAASLGAGSGDTFLAMLLAHHAKTTEDDPIPLSGRLRSRRENFFHLVARHDALKLAAVPKLIRQCAEQCPTTAEMMCEMDIEGYTPVMRLLDPSHERGVLSRRQTTDPEKLELMRDLDNRLSELLVLYAEKTTMQEAFIRRAAVLKLRAQSEINKIKTDDGDHSVKSDDNDGDYEDAIAPSSQRSGSDGSEGSDNDEHGDDDTDEDDDDDDDDDDDIANDSNNLEAARQDSSIQSSDELKGIMVEYETALHFIAKRKLTCEPAQPWLQWYGSNLMTVLSEKRPELFAGDKGAHIKSLVNFVHLGTFKTPLHYAAETGDVPTMQLLLTYKADANMSPVRCASCTAFADDDAIKQANEPGANGSTASDRQIACMGNCGTKALVEPALFVAVRNKRFKCVRLLLEHGAQVDCVSMQTRETPLHVALRANDGLSVIALLSHGASLMARDIRGASPLHLAVIAKHSIPAKEPHAGEVAYSTVTDSNPNSLRRDSSSPSVVAHFSVELTNETRLAKETEPAILVALRNPSAHNAVVMGDSKNRTPVHFAARNRDLELLDALLRAVGPVAARDAVNQRDALGRTPLHYAVNAAAMSADASFAVERFLLQNGANADIQDSFGFSTLHFALLKVDLEWQDKYDARDESQKGEKDQECDVASYENDKRAAFLREQLAAIPDGETDPLETVSNLAAVSGLHAMAQDALGRSPLHLAAATGAFVCVSTLLVASGSSQTEAMALQDHDEFTPLGLAVLYKRQTAIMTLLRSGSAVDGKLRIAIPPSPGGNKQQKAGGTKKTRERESKVKTRSYFYHALKHGLTGICRLLLNAKFSRRQAIEDAVRCGQFQLTNNLLGVLETGAYGGLELLKLTNARDETLLHSLAKVHQTGFELRARKLAWDLVDAGVRVDARDAKGNLALHYAAKRGNTHLLDFLHHQPGGEGSENVINKDGETPLLFALKQKTRDGGLEDNKLLVTLCYFLEHPLFSMDVHATDASGMNILGAFLDRFTEGLAKAQPLAFFTYLEMMLKRGVNPNASFQTLHAATLLPNTNTRKEEEAEEEQLLGSGRQPREVISLAKGDSTKMPPLVRVALTPEPSIRFHALALLLRYGAKLSTADGCGNTLLMHLVARNLIAETRLVLGLVNSVPDPIDVFTPESAEDGSESSSSNRVCSLHVPEASVKAALAQSNAAGVTACHVAVQPLVYGSYENTRMLAMLVRAGGDLRAKDATGKSPVDYARAQRSHFMLRFLQRTFPQAVSVRIEASEAATTFATAPAYSDDATAYVAECETSGKISRSRLVPGVNASCDVGSVSSVHSEGEGGELDALLTKVDVKNGRFGLNVFYRLQVVHDELQGIFVLFTNWGRIGETGKFQNTPFRDEAEAVSEFKKIFRSKTGNAWEARAPGEFMKKPKKYNLIQRVNYATKVDDEVTRSFREDMEVGAKGGAVFPDPRDPDLAGTPSVLAMLAAITDVRNLQLAAETSCGFAGGDLPLAKQDELRAALEKLREIRTLLEEKVELVKEIGVATGDLSDEGTTRRALLATRHEALTERVSERSSRYYEVMPCHEGSDTLASSIRAFDEVSDVDVEITRLRLLSDIMETYKMLLGAKRKLRVQNPLEYCYHALQVRLAPLAPGDAERQLIHRYFFGGLRPGQRELYRISNVFEVERRGESQRFNELMAERPDLRAMQTHLLWHGTKRTNLMGILSQGLRVAPPEAPHQGYAFGKGLYFAEVASKSLDYCDSPYALPVMAPTDGSKAVAKSTKTREVHYMLLCEVALGKSSNLTAAAAWGEKPLLHDGTDSVKALANHTPDPNGVLVSPKCGAQLHVGRVKRVGSELPFERVWAKTDPSPQPSGRYERNPNFAANTQAYLDKLVSDKSFVVGNTHSVTDNDRALFIHYLYAQSTVTIEMMSRESPEASAGSTDGEEDGAGFATDHGAVGAWCEATVKVTIQPENSPSHSYFAKLYRNVLTRSPLAKDYTLAEPSLLEYAELVVYKEAQARLRYVVEVETVSR